MKLVLLKPFTIKEPPEGLPPNKVIAVASEQIGLVKGVKLTKTPDGSSVKLASSAPISGVEVRVFPSKSVVIPEMATPFPSVELVVCRCKLGIVPVGSMNLGSLKRLLVSLPVPKAACHAQKWV